MNETLTGRTTRTVCFTDKAQIIRLGHSLGGASKPAGTLVYVTALRTPGLFRVRVPGTLLEQDVPLSAVEPE